MAHALILLNQAGSGTDSDMKNVKKIWKYTSVPDKIYRNVVFSDYWYGCDLRGCRVSVWCESWLHVPFPQYYPDEFWERHSWVELEVTFSLNSYWELGNLAAEYYIHYIKLRFMYKGGRWQSVCAPLVCAYITILLDALNLNCTYVTFKMNFKMYMLCHNVSFLTV